MSQIVNILTNGTHSAPLTSLSNGGVTKYRLNNRTDITNQWKTELTQARPAFESEVQKVHSIL